MTASMMSDAENKEVENLPQGVIKQFYYKVTGF
jgi:hypothetical protein